MKMKEFRLTRMVVLYEQVIIEAKSKEAALKRYHRGKISGWEEDDVSGRDYLGLEAIEERGASGEFSIQYDVQGGELL